MIMNEKMAPDWEKQGVKNTSLGVWVVCRCGQYSVPQEIQPLYRTDKSELGMRLFTPNCPWLTGVLKPSPACFPLCHRMEPVGDHLGLQKVRRASKRQPWCGHWAKFCSPQTTVPLPGGVRMDGFWDSPFLRHGEIWSVTVNPERSWMNFRFYWQFSLTWEW